MLVNQLNTNSVDNGLYIGYDSFVDEGDSKLPIFDYDGTGEFGSQQAIMNEIRDGYYDSDIDIALLGGV